MKTKQIRQDAICIIIVLYLLYVCILASATISWEP